MQRSASKSCPVTKKVARNARPMFCQWHINALHLPLSLKAFSIQSPVLSPRPAHIVISIAADPA
jgi:hypothetical protein